MLRKIENVSLLKDWMSLEIEELVATAGVTQAGKKMAQPNEDGDFAPKHAD